MNSAWFLRTCGRASREPQVRTDQNKIWYIINTDYFIRRKPFLRIWYPWEYGKWKTSLFVSASPWGKLHLRRMFYYSGLQPGVSKPPKVCEDILITYSIPVIGRGGLRIPHCLDNRIIDRAKDVGPTHRPHFTLTKHNFFMFPVLIYVRDWVNPRV
jgi:hypothetical protein